MTKNTTGEDLARFARGRYQKALLSGRAAWSGADLQGLARRYGAHYRNSRDNLLERLRAAGYTAEYRYGGVPGRAHNYKWVYVALKDKPAA